MEIIKRGERVGELSMSRGVNGLTIIAKVHPSIEELLRSWGSGERQAVAAYGRHWQADEPLTVHSLTQDVPSQMRSGNDVYTLKEPGQPMVNEQGVLNLSFLRLVGISAGSGIKFSIRGVHSKDSADNIRGAVGKAIRQFYMDYLLPIDLNVVISSEDVRR